MRFCVTSMIHLSLHRACKASFRSTTQHRIASRAAQAQRLPSLARPTAGDCRARATPGVARICKLWPGG